MKNDFSGALIGLLLFSAATAHAVPPTDPAQLKEYQHDKDWLATQPRPFIATNIRGEGKEYALRREAAFDLIKEHNDRSATSELLTELERGSILGGEICDLLGDWGEKRALPTLKEVAENPKQSQDVRQKAVAAISKIEAAKPLAPPPPGLQ